MTPLLLLLACAPTEPAPPPAPTLGDRLPGLVEGWAGHPSVEASWARVDGVGEDLTAGDVPAAVPLGSLRKWTTAAVVVSLVDDGAVDLDAPVGRWLPAWEARPEVTLRRLLSHTSGLPMRPPAGTCKDLGDLAACVDAIAAVPAAFEPGTRFGYSTTGFHVAARAAEVAGGAGFEALFDARVAKPLGLTSARFEPAGPGLPDMTGTLYLSPDDLLRFVRGVVSGEGAQGRWLSPAASTPCTAGPRGACPRSAPSPAGSGGRRARTPTGSGCGAVACRSTGGRASCSARASRRWWPATTAGSTGPSWWASSTVPAPASVPGSCPTR